jgi:hypothetical protein
MHVHLGSYSTSQTICASRTSSSFCIYRSSAYRIRIIPTASLLKMAITPPRNKETAAFTGLNIRP